MNEIKNGFSYKLNPSPYIDINLTYSYRRKQE